MADIFNRSTDSFGGSFAADQAKVTFPALTGNNGADTGLLVQNMSLTYTQSVSRLYEIGSTNVYYVGGRTSGDASLQRVIGPRKLATAFYSTYGDICNARTNTLHFSVATGCDGAQSGTARSSFTAHFVVITTIGVTLQSADMLISETLQLMFSSLLYS